MDVEAEQTRITEKHDLFYDHVSDQFAIRTVDAIRKKLEQLEKLSTTFSMSISVTLRTSATLAI